MERNPFGAFGGAMAARPQEIVMPQFDQTMPAAGRQMLAALLAKSGATSSGSTPQMPDAARLWDIYERNNKPAPFVPNTTANSYGAGGAMPTYNPANGTTAF
jgi:hypothetical protein